MIKYNHMNNKVKNLYIMSFNKMLYLLSECILQINDNQLNIIMWSKYQIQSHYIYSL